MDWLKRDDRVTLIICGINVLVFIGLTCFGMTEDAYFMLGKGALYVPYMTEYGEYYRLITSLFLHFGIEHLGNNMLLLIIVGKQLEPELGSVKFAILYLCAGLGGSALSIWSQVLAQEYVISGGASGAIFGAIGAMLWVVIRNRGNLGSFNSSGLIFMILLSLYSGYTSSGVDNLAHVGGLVVGIFLCALLYRKRDEESCADICG